MLRELAIRDFVIVKDVSLPLASGFSVLTGETGAGKSILIDALSLVLGGRASGDVIRAGATRAEITAVFEPNQTASEWLKQHDLAADDDVILRRLIDNQGKTRAYINGTIVPLNQLKALGDCLVDIHGQHMHQSLMRPDVQRDLLDAQSGVGAQHVAIIKAWHQWQQAQKDLAQALEGAQQLAERQEALTYQSEELEKLAPEPLEWDKISDEHSRLSHGQSLIEAASAALSTIDDDEMGTQRTVDMALDKLRHVLKHDAKLRDIEQSLESASIAVNQARSDLARYIDGLDLDPGRLDELEQRLKSLYDAARKYRCEPADLPDLAQRTRNELAALAQAQDIDALKRAEKSAADHYLAVANELSEGRRKGAKQLARAVSKHMQTLGMPGGQFDIAIDRANPSQNGIDKITFMVAGHEGAPLAAMTKVASGGELSRVALALSVVASETTRVPTLIFDEVDSGVSGAVAEKVGQLLRSLGTRHQVLCVTHLPQVAACGNHHHRVAKSRDKDGAVTSSISTLDDAARVQAVAELLGGAKITGTTLDHAQELLKQQGG
jgi:DNA repair protein RecN (Recombination protein N)